MKGEWSYYTNYFSHDFCQHVIDKALTVDNTDASIGYDNVIKDDSYRRSKIRWLHTTDPKFDFLVDAFWKIGILLNREFFRFNITTLSSLQFTEYDSIYAGEYKSHQDVFWINPSENHRKVSMVVQLSDPSDYVGGDLEFDFLSETPPANTIRSRGTVIAFPSFIYHKVTPVTQGKRYSLVGWFEGPKFQ